MQGTSLYKLYTVYENHIYLKYSIICRKCERYLIRSLWFWIGRLCDWFRISRHTRIHLEADRAPNVTPLVFYGARSYYVTILCLLSFLLALTLTSFFDFMTVRVTVFTLTSICRLSTVLNAFSKVQTRRIWLTISSSFSNYILLFSQPFKMCGWHFGRN